MLAKQARLMREAVAEVVARGSRYGGPALGLRVLFDRTSAKPARFAIVVPAKQIPLAVTRHQIKRRVRVVLQRLSPELSTGFAIVVFCGRETRDWNLAKFSAEIRQLFIQAKLVH